MSLKIFTEKRNSPSTIEAMATQFRIISTDTISNFESFDIFSHCDYFTYRFVAGDQRELEYQRYAFTTKRREDTFAMNSPSWICKSVPQTPHAPTTPGQLTTTQTRTKSIQIELHRKRIWEQTFNQDISISNNRKRNLNNRMFPGFLIPKSFHRRRQSTHLF